MPPPTENRTAARPDLVIVQIDGVVAPFFAKVEYDITAMRAPLRPASVGMVIEEIVTGHTVTGTITFEQTTELEVRQFLETRTDLGFVGDALASGTLMPKHAVTFKSPFDASGASNINIGAVTFGAVKRSIDGSPETLAQIDVPFTGLLPAVGPFYSVKSVP